MLAIDLGSSWCKAAYIDREGRVVAEGRAYTRDIAPARDGMLELFWDAVVLAVGNARVSAPQPLRPVAIGVSCRGLFGVCLDACGQGFWPAWDYGSIKSSPDARRAYSPAIWGDKDPYAHGYGVRLAGLAVWLKRTHPDDWKRVARIGSLHDYVLYRLTDSWLTDPTTGPEQASWPDEIIAMSELPASAFPSIHAPEAIVGGLVPEAAVALEAEPGTPVVTGFHDGAAANRGTGTVNAGDACFTLGTNFVLRAVTGARLNSECFCYTVAPGQWAWVSNVPRASHQLDIVAQTLAGNNNLGASHGRFGDLADGVPPGSAGLIVDTIPAGHEAALRESVTRALAGGYSEGTIYRAMIETIALGVRDLLDRARRDGAMPRRFVATGGSARNAQLLRILSAMIDRPIQVGDPEAGMLGAGMAATVAAGWDQSLDDAMERMTSTGPLVEPDHQVAAFYKQLRSERRFFS